MEIVRAYDEDGNKVYVYVVARGVYLDDTETKTLSNLISEYNQKFTDTNNSITNLKKDKLNISDIVDSFKGTDPKKPLASNKGKYLYDNSLVFKGTLAADTDFNNLVEPGIYYIDDATNMSHTPTDVAGQISKSFITVIASDEAAIHEITRLRDSMKWSRSKVSDSVGWGTWQRYKAIKTTIEDKDVTSLDLPNSSGTLNYFIEDGWCTCEFKNISGNGTNLEIMETTELPTPKLSTPCYLENNGTSVGTIYIEGKTTGSGVKITAHKTAETLGFGTVTYKIDASKY